MAPHQQHLPGLLSEQRYQDMKLSPEFLRLKREILARIRDELLKLL